MMEILVIWSGNYSIKLDRGLNKSWLIHGFRKKNRGEIHALALAKVKAISVFVTDKSDLQPIVDQQLNTQMHNILYRIIDIIKEIQSGQLIGLARKHAVPCQETFPRYVQTCQR